MATVLLGEARGLQEGDLPVSVQVLLVPTQDDHDVLTGKHPGITEPRGQGVVGLTADTEIETDRQTDRDSERETETQRERQ